MTGEPKTGGNGIEAELDIQYMMGVALGIKTEFYEQMNMSFCFDLKAWTTLLLSTDDIPLVHSISYGWQGNLTQIGCADADVAVIDDDYKKLAAKGITIIFASGDSGSGYTLYTENGVKKGSVVDFVDKLARDHGFTMEAAVVTQDSRDAVRAAFDSGSSFSACVHAVAIGQVDLCIGNFWVTNDRMLMATSFTAPIYDDQLRLIVPVGGAEPTIGERMIQPFVVSTHAARLCL